MAFDYIPLWDKYAEILEPLSDEELGRLVRAMMAYKDGGAPDLPGGERYIWPVVKRDIDQVREKYEKKVADGNKGGRPKKTTDNHSITSDNHNITTGNHSITTGNHSITSDNHRKPQRNHRKPQQTTAKPPETNINVNVNDNVKDNIISPNGEYIAPEGAAPANEAKKSFGQFGWVKLTESEYNRLLNDFGEAEVKRCIAYVDESAQSSGNKNRWRDWNLVVRRCHRDGWGKQAVTGRQNGLMPRPENRQASAVALKKDMDWMDEFLEGAK